MSMQYYHHRSQFVSRYQVASLSPCPECMAGRVTFDRFKVKAEIGQGSFGCVLLVEDQATGQRYALKKIEKDRMLQQDQVRHCVQERKFLASVNFTFIVKMVTHFQTKKDLCLIMEYVAGGDLFHCLRRMGSLQEDWAKFYLAEILLALQYLHGVGLIFRDLKLENVLLTSSGHVKLADFGLATVASKCNRTFCGTVEYIAPEIIAGENHGEAVDFWALGILAFELVDGSPPFTASGRCQETEKKQKEIIEKVKSGNLRIPEKFSPELENFCLKLLERNAAKRLEASKKIRNDRFFWGIEWKDAIEGKLEPPYIPGDITDLSKRFTEPEVPESYVGIEDNFIDF